MYVCKKIELEVVTWKELNGRKMGGACGEEKCFCVEQHEWVRVVRGEGKWQEDWAKNVGPKGSDKWAHGIGGGPTQNPLI